MTEPKFENGEQPEGARTTNNEPRYELDEQGNLRVRECFLPLLTSEEFLVTAMIGYVVAMKKLATATGQDGEYLSYLIGDQAYKEEQKMTRIQKIEFLRENLNYFNYSWDQQHWSQFSSRPPQYEIGDRFPHTNIYVRGVMTTSTGKHRYFLQIGDDNSMVVDEPELAPTLSILTNNPA